MRSKRNSRSLRINLSSSAVSLLRSLLASVNSSDSLTQTVLNNNILPNSLAVLNSPGQVLIGNQRARFTLSLLGQISVRCIVEKE